jgi:predicted dehydrogenase
VTAGSVAGRQARSGPVGVAIVGAGKISEQYLAHLATYPDVQVRFVADLFPQLAGAKADEFGIAASGTVEEAMAAEDVEIVVNLTVPVAHAEVASAALAAGKHVWNEKPLALQRDAGAVLVAQAAETGLLLGCAPDTVLGPGLQTGLRMIRGGDIGRPLTASIVFQTGGPHHWHPNPDFLYQAGGGPLLDMGPYYLTAVTQVFGPIAGVAARASTMSPTRTIGSGPRAGEVFDVTVPTFVTAIYDFSAGEIAAATFSFDSPLSRVGVLEIAGTDATIALPDPNRFGGDVRLFRAGVDDPVTVSVDEAGAGRGIGVVDMARALRTGGRHRATGEQGLHVLDAMYATLESAEMAASVPVTSTFGQVEPLPADWDPLARSV